MPEEKENEQEQNYLEMSQAELVDLLGFDLVIDMDEFRDHVRLDTWIDLETNRIKAVREAAWPFVHKDGKKVTRTKALMLLNVKLSQSLALTALFWKAFNLANGIDPKV
jgi:hypothetical protein